MLLYWFMLGIAAAVALTTVVFFFWGLADGSVQAFNIELWLALLGGTAAVLLGGWKLNSTGRRGAACAVLAILAVPGLLFALFLVSVLILQPRWNQRRGPARSAPNEKGPGVTAPGPSNSTEHG